MCDSKKIMKEQEASGLLSSLGIKMFLSYIPLLGPLCFKSVKQINIRYKNEWNSKQVLRKINSYLKCI